MTDEEIEKLRTGEFKDLDDELEFYKRPPVPITIIPRPK